MSIEQKRRGRTPNDGGPGFVTGVVVGAAGVGLIAMIAKAFSATPTAPVGQMNAPSVPRLPPGAYSGRMMPD